MDKELLQNQLCQLHGKRLVVVRPAGGTQSDSWSGMFSVHSEKFPVKFQVVAELSATTFQIDDVREVKEEQGRQLAIITLKGPNEYITLFGSLF